MSVFKDNYTSFLKDMEENIKNKEDLEYIKKRFEQLYKQKVHHQIIKFQKWKVN